MCHHQVILYNIQLKYLNEVLLNLTFDVKVARLFDQNSLLSHRRTKKNFVNLVMASVDNENKYKFI